MAGTITVFSTAGHLLRIKDPGPIATAFGVPAEDVFTVDWLKQLVDDDRSDADWQISASVAAVRTQHVPLLRVHVIALGFCSCII
jgi:hypothetical protein